jgi:type IV pilus assembly protein PilB
MLEHVNEILEELKKNNQIKEDYYQELLQKITDNPAEVLVSLENDGKVPMEILVQAKSKILNVPYVNLEGKPISGEVLRILPQDLAENYEMLVFNKESNRLDVGMINPLNYKAVEAIEFLARKKNYKIRYFIISHSSFNDGYKGYESLNEQVNEALDFAEEKFAPKETKEAGNMEDATQLEEMIKTAPVSKMISVILRHAIDGGASDIHIEPYGDKSRVRYRIDGVLHTSIIMPIYVHAALVARVKVISNLKIDETRIPQDGRMRLNIGDKDVDLRVSILPLINQEKVEMRILRSADKAPTFEDLGFLGVQIEVINKNIAKPNGMFLVTGPTGSGKSTTLFSALGVLNKEGVNISTLEDPVEYHVLGVNQSQIKPEIGFTFASGLRALLRQDPNVIMVGEIRDKETAELAVHAALTGHFVLSTLHTNDAIGTVPRLMDMGVEPFLLSSTLNVIVSQRLVRLICPDCKTRIDLPADIRIEIEEELAKINPDAMYKGVKENKDFIVYHGAGCAKCGNSGYRGRLAVAEVLNVSPNMRKIISEHFDHAKVEQELKEQKFVSIAADGWMKVLLGLTTVEEILRAIKTES